jgi:alpha-tubulin suppressor-like RCC1 family protein
VSTLLSFSSPLGAFEALWRAIASGTLLEARKTYSLTASSPTSFSVLGDSGAVVESLKRALPGAQAPARLPFDNACVANESEGRAKLAVGDQFTCTLSHTGQVKCWGANSDGQLGDGTTTSRSTPLPVAGLGTVRDLGAANGHVCALNTDSEVWCWGDNWGGQLGNGTTTSSSSPVRVSGAPSAVVALALGSGHTCALTEPGRVWCWGYNGQGQLGIGTQVDSSVPVEVTALPLAVKSIASNARVGWHTCAVKHNSEVACWGSNWSGQIGDGTLADALSPKVVPGISNAAMAVPRDSGTCALTQEGSVLCWGDAASIASDGTVTDSLTPVGVPGIDGRARYLGVARTGMCAGLDDGRLTCWGGGIDSSESTVPQVIPGLSGVSAFAGNNTHHCALLSSGRVRCWGSNTLGQLGIDTGINNLYPSPIPLSESPGIFANSLQAGFAHNCLLDTNGAVRCWGPNSPGPVSDNLHPGSISGISGATQISLGGDWNCAHLTSGEVKCWGSSPWAGLGVDPKVTSSGTPLSVTGISDAQSVHVGGQHACVVHSDASVSCWGLNNVGQLGDGTTTNQNTPVPIPGLTGVSKLAVGSQVMCALLNDETVKCLGSNWRGTVGNGTFGHATTPQNTGLTGVKDLSLSASTACAVLANGTVRCWGDNSGGQVGDGTTTDRNTPTEVPGLTSISRISAGGSHVCAVRTNGEVKCWGYNGWGNLGGSGLSSNVLVPTTVEGVADAVEVAASGKHTCARHANGSVTCWGELIGTRYLEALRPEPAGLGNIGRAEKVLRLVQPGAMP